MRGRGRPRKRFAGIFLGEGGGGRGWVCGKGGGWEGEELEGEELEGTVEGEEEGAGTGVWTAGAESEVRGSGGCGG